MTMRIATSLISIDQAKDNLRQEIPKRASFDKVKRDAQKQWDKILGKVEVEGATQDQLTTLYSSLYRLYLYPNAGHEKVAGKVPVRLPVLEGGQARTPRPRPAPRSWTARSTSTTASGTPTGPPGPRTRSSPRRQAGELVDGFVQQYKDGGWTSRWSSPATRT